MAVSPKFVLAVTFLFVFLSANPASSAKSTTGCPSKVKIAHGQLIGDTSELGSIREISCDDGYTKQGAGFLICLSGTWLQLGQCCLIACGLPLTIIENGYFSNGPSDVGTKRRVICNQGFSFSGTKDTIECQRTGHWDAPVGSCTPDFESLQHEMAMTTTTNENADSSKELFQAVSNGNLQQLKRIIQMGTVDVNAKDSSHYDYTALHYAARIGHTAMAGALLLAGANVEARTTFGATPLIIASTFGRAAVCQLLIQNGADVNAKDGDGWTPLLYASYYGFDAIVRLLAENANINTLNYKDKDNYSALHYATERKFPTIQAYLRSKGATA